MGQASCGGPGWEVEGIAAFATTIRVRVPGRNSGEAMAQRCNHCDELVGDDDDHECQGDQSPETARVRRLYADDLARRFPSRAPRFLPSEEPEE